MKLFAFFLVIFLTLTACSQQAVIVNHEPSWILNPSQDGKFGAVGVAARTYDQKISSQRKLAITRALDELSLQQGVSVSLNVTKKDSLKYGKSTTNLNSQSAYNSNNKITAHIEKVWKDKSTNELYIWMVLD